MSRLRPNRGCGRRFRPALPWTSRAAPNGGALAPKGRYQALSYALVITGWVLTNTVITGVTRTVSRQ
ncbi:MAG: hypothetical protein HOQ47_00350 [Streptomyces sp.]|nr:hypothetical protein [Streptomyces sp.]NUS28509.1 hypothetical protein [Streptomyces sp.]